MDNQEQIVLRCQLGDPTAWESLVRQWHPVLLPFLQRLLGDHATAEDVCQNVWVQIVRSLIRLRDPTRLDAWIYRIARNAAADRMRKAYREPFRDTGVDGIPTDSDWESLEREELIETGLTRLHPADREVVVLHYFEDRSLDEIADVCGIPVGTVKSRLHRSRKQMKERICDETDDC